MLGDFLRTNNLDLLWLLVIVFAKAWNGVLIWWLVGDTLLAEIIELGFIFFSSIDLLLFVEIIRELLEIAVQSIVLLAQIH